MTEEPPKRPALRYHGSKWRIAPWVIANMSPHKIYVEPYGGAAGVLLRKPRSQFEYYNDLDGDIVNVFRVLRDPAKANYLAQLIALTPFAREEFAASYQDAEDDVERARRTLARSFMGFSSAAVTRVHRTGFRQRSERVRGSVPLNWAGYPAAIPAFTARLQGVTIDNVPALELIDMHDDPYALFYVDPPYVFGSREMSNGGLSPKCYQHEMNDADHVALAETLRAARGRVMVSGYPSALYEELYEGWHRVTRQSWASGKTGGVERTECLWISPGASR